MAERFPSVNEMVERIENSPVWPHSQPPVASDLNARCTRAGVYAHVPPVQISSRTEATTHHISYQDDFNQQMLQQFMSTLRMEEFEAPPAMTHHMPGTGNDAFNCQPSSRTHAAPAPPPLAEPAQPTRPFPRSSQPSHRLPQPTLPRADNRTPHLPLHPAHPQPTPIFHTMDEFPAPLAWQDQPYIPRRLQYTESVDYDSVFSPDDTFDDFDDEEQDIIADLLSVPQLNPQAYSTPAMPVQAPHVPPTVPPVWSSIPRYVPDVPYVPPPVQQHTPVVPPTAPPVPPRAPRDPPEVPPADPPAAPDVSAASTVPATPATPATPPEVPLQLQKFHLPPHQPQ